MFAARFVLTLAPIYFVAGMWLSRRVALWLEGWVGCWWDKERTI